MISPHTIEKIMDTAQIDEVVGEFLSLKKRGVNYISTCPFHDEKTPSFIVSPSKGIYKCFGCGAAGNTVKFVMEHQQMSYPDALRFLADKYQVEIEENTSSEQQEAIKSKDSLYLALSFAHTYFQNTLHRHPEGERIGLSYFKERGFNSSIIEKFQLGYALKEKDAFVQYARTKGYPQDILLKAGLIRVKNQVESDFYRGRVLFPIHNMSGKVLGFGGRILDRNIKAPKYINTPDSEVYNKSEVLYGAYFAKLAIRKADNCILVEGYTDVLSLYQAGIQNVVASSGTSLTVPQIKLIKRMTQNITIVFDGDTAGIQAAMRGVDLILEQDVHVQILVLPTGEDPDSYIRKVGQSGFTNYLEKESKDFILFKTTLLSEHLDDSPSKKTAVIQELINSISKIPNSITRSIYTKKCSTIVDINEQLLITHINKKRRNHLNKKQKVKQLSNTKVEGENNLESEINRAEVSSENKLLHVCERELIRVLIEYGHLPIYDQTETDDDLEEKSNSIYAYVLAELKDIDFVDDIYKSILIKVSQLLFDGHDKLTADFYTNHQDETISTLAIELLSDKYELSPNWKIKFGIDIDKNMYYKKTVFSTIARFKLTKIGDMIQENQKKLTQDGLSYEDKMQILVVHQHLILMRQQLSKELGIVVPL